MTDIKQTIAEAITGKDELQDGPQDRRARLEMQVEDGRRYGFALETLSDFLEAQQLSVIQSLQYHEYTGQDELNDLLAQLRVIRDFADVARTYYKLGKDAEEELNQEEGLMNG